MVTWNATFNSLPQDTDAANNGANEIRILKVAIANRCNLEMNWEDESAPLLKAGVAAVCYAGNQTDIDALSSPSNGALAYNDELHVFQRANDDSFANLSIYHNELGNLSGDIDDHPQYLKLDKANQTLTANLSVDTDITIAGSNVANLAPHEANDAATAHANGLGVILGTPEFSGYTEGANNETTTDGILVTREYLVAAKTLSVYLDGAVRAMGGGPLTTANSHVTLTIPVPKGSTWRVVGNGGAAMYWFPIGS